MLCTFLTSDPRWSVLCKVLSWGSLQSLSLVSNFLFLVFPKLFPLPFVIKLCLSRTELERFAWCNVGDATHPFVSSLFSFGLLWILRLSEWSCLCVFVTLLNCSYTSVLPSVWLSFTFLSDDLLWEIFQDKLFYYVAQEAHSHTPLSFSFLFCQHSLCLAAFYWSSWLSHLCCLLLSCNSYCCYSWHTSSLVHKQ